MRNDLIAKLESKENAKAFNSEITKSKLSEFERIDKISSFKSILSEDSLENIANDFKCFILKLINIKTKFAGQ